MKMKKDFPARVVCGLCMEATVGFYDQPCMHGETDGFVMYKSVKKSYDKLYTVEFRRDKHGDAIAVTMKNMMERKYDGSHVAEFSIVPHHFIIVQNGDTDELSVFYYGGTIEDGMYYVGRFSDEMERKLLAYVNGMRKFFRDFARTRREMAVSAYLDVENRKKVVILTDKDEYHRLCRKGIKVSRRMHSAFADEARINRSKEQFERDRMNCRNRAVRVYQCADGAWRDANGRVRLEDGYMEDGHF